MHNFSNSRLGASCAALLEMLGRDSTCLRVDLQSAGRIAKFSHVEYTKGRTCGRGYCGYGFCVQLICLFVCHYPCLLCCVAESSQYRDDKTDFNQLGDLCGGILMTVLHNSCITSLVLHLSIHCVLRRGTLIAC